MEVTATSCLKESSILQEPQMVSVTIVSLSRWLTSGTRGTSRWSPSRGSPLPNCLKRLISDLELQIHHFHSWMGIQFAKFSRLRRAVAENKVMINFSNPSRWSPNPSWYYVRARIGKRCSRPDLRDHSLSEFETPGGEDLTGWRRSSPPGWRRFKIRYNQINIRFCIEQTK